MADESITAVEARELLRETNNVARNLLLTKEEMAIVMRVYSGAKRRAGIE